MAKGVTGKASIRAQEDYKRVQKQDALEFIITTARHSREDGNKFRRRRKETLMTTFALLLLELKHKGTDGRLVEDLVRVLSFMSVYGRVPEISEVRDLDLKSAIEYFKERYSDLIFGPED